MGQKPLSTIKYFDGSIYVGEIN